MAGTVVDRLYLEFAALVEHIGSAEPSLRVTADENFRKALLLAAASLFEARVKEAIVTITSDLANGSDLVVSLVRAKAVERQYHTYFKWDGNNANSFFSLFGDGFKGFMEARVRAEPELQDSIRAFLELGSDRNRLLHQDYGTFVMEKTSDEVFRLYERARRFVDALPAWFQEYCEATAQSPDPA